MYGPWVAGEKRHIIRDHDLQPLQMNYKSPRPCSALGLSSDSVTKQQKTSDESWMEGFRGGIYRRHFGTRLALHRPLPLFTPWRGSRLTVSQKLILSVIYNIYVHPLRKYPGPRLSAASKLPLIHAIYSGTRSRLVHNLHQRYGPVVRVAPNELCYTDPRAWKDIHGAKETRPHGMMRDVSFFRIFEDETAIASIVTADEEEYARLRGAYLHHLRSLLATYESLFTRHADLLVEKLRAVADKPVDMTAMFSIAIFDLIAQACFGGPPQLSKDRTWMRWAENQKNWIKGSVILAGLSELRLVRLVFALVPSTFLDKQRRSYLDLTSLKISQRVQSEKAEPDIVGLALRSNDRFELSEADLKANAPFILSAGVETTASALNNLVALLLSRPDCLLRLTEEIRGTFASTLSIDAGTVSRLTYLDACVRESLRVYSPVGGSLPRKVPPPGTTIADRWVPGGTRVSISLHSSFRSPAYFRSADEFAPERWLPCPNSPFSSDRKAAFQPFGSGRQSCIGQE